MSIERGLVVARSDGGERSFCESGTFPSGSRYERRVVLRVGGEVWTFEEVSFLGSVGQSSM